MNGKLASGRIIKLSDKGYGFISSRDIPFTRIFFHWSALQQDTLKFLDLKLGMTIEFEPKEFEKDGKKSIRAIKIKVQDETKVG